MFLRHIFLIAIFMCFQHISQAADQATLERLADLCGVNTPNKTAVRVLATQGLPGLPALQQKKAKEQEEQRREETRKKIDFVEEQRVQDQEEHKEILRQEREASQATAFELEREKEAIRQMFGDLLRQEREAAQYKERDLQKKEEELHRLRQDFQRQQEEFLNAQKALAEKQKQIEGLKSSTSSQPNPEVTRQLEELQRALEQERAKRVEESDVELRQRLEALEQEKVDLLGALATSKGGQALPLTKDSVFIRYNQSFIHIDDLKDPDISLDAELQQRLKSIDEKVKALFTQIQSSSNLKPIQKRLTLNQLERLQEGLEEFEPSSFMRTFGEVKSQLPNLADSPTFVEISEAMEWLETKKEDLIKVSEHKVYQERQLQVFKIAKEKTKEFNEFYDNYLDETVLSMCVSLASEGNEGESVQDTKRAFLSSVKTSSIPALRNYLTSSIPIYGTNDSFLTQAFLKSGKSQEYTKFKSILISYSTLFSGLGEHAKLVEEILNYQYFQERFQKAYVALKSLDLSPIKDLQVKPILEQVQQKNVLNYNETQTAIFASSVSKAMPAYLAKIPVIPEENAILTRVEEALIYYAQLDFFAKNMRISNPKMVRFHSRV
jgi:hypothetical protein